MHSNVRLPFFKYQGTGNDFIIIDNRQDIFPKNNTKLVAKLCDRKFGIGADGLILLEDDTMSDFKMVYYNSDGNESTMCGNGGRCIVAFAKELGLIQNTATFYAVDGMHKAEIKNGLVALHMKDVKNIRSKTKYHYLNTGSPHHVQYHDDLKNLEVKREGAKIRYGLYGKEGSNINFTRQVDTKTFEVRTYERGVENETLSCGTGVTAVALAMHHDGKTSENELNILTQGGKLAVSFQKEGDTYTSVTLTGPADFVFKGEIQC
ncbi:diaminopimelate epimerase [Allomuricauda sp. SCSIO 65647]|uniref:diaminopimelate epimerase n=1 Tax=Allomuricauda sp. SCSIO 65647 TaxID=2908843 RepID=UPI001F3C92D7|nr:diaminopimelate epimerase [Muricauda sp. SCSIO 65647]UJH67625.1 diaminopimelate epimerase [Muricauda sp. SCSIO 65647]